MRKSNLGWLAKIRKIEKINDIRYVYNLEVENDHHYVANGMYTNNCVYDSVNKRSSNRYTPGGPIVFRDGQTCPFCHGLGTTGNITTSGINLTPIWDHKDWLPIFGGEAIRTPENFVQTISAISTLGALKRAKDILIDTDLSDDTSNTFIRHSEPQPCGFGNSSYIFTMWKRAGGK